jgi:glycerophosphoryl diester phosphodiesterase
MIRALTADQLSWYQCDRNPDVDRFPGQTSVPGVHAGDGYGIVTLGELFDFVATYGTSDVKTEKQRASAARVRFNIETKRRSDEPGTIGDGFDGVNAGPFELEMLRVIGEYGLSERVVIQSFDHRSLWAVHAADPSVTLAALSVRPIDLDDVASRGASIWSPSQDAVTAALIQAAHDAGLLVIPWTVNDPNDMHRLISLGVDGLITDRPDILVPMESAG